MSKPKDQMRYLNVNRYLLNRQSLISESTDELENQVQAIIKKQDFRFKF